LHFVEHGRLHPLIQSGELNRLGTTANQAASLARWKC
jgi:hypothetical protein